MPRGIPNAVLERDELAPEQIVQTAPDLPVIGATGYKFYWSSREHMGMLRGHETVFPFTRPEWTDLPDDPLQRQMARRQETAFRRDYTKEERDTFDRAFEALGTNSIKWSYVDGPSNGINRTTGFVWYGTDNPDVAFVIRNDLKAGFDGAFIKELDQETVLRVGDLAYANNDLARKLAFEKMEATGEPIVPEKKAS